MMHHLVHQTFNCTMVHLTCETSAILGCTKGLIMQVHVRRTPVHHLDLKTTPMQLCRGTQHSVSNLKYYNIVLVLILSLITVSS